MPAKMEEAEFRKTYNEIRKLACPFEKALLSRQCNCAMARRFNLAEREGISCTAWKARRDCDAFLALLRDKARFALGLPAVSGPLPHAKEIKLQMGSLTGLQQVVQQNELPATWIKDIHALLAAAREQFGSLETLPFSAIMKAVSAYRGRRRRKPRKPG